MKKLVYVSFQRKEIILWMISTLLLMVTFIISQGSFLLLGVTWIGVTALLYLAKGEPLGQILTILFSMSYAIISFELRYFSETVTYAFMTLPSAFIALISWLKHPYQKDKATVKVGFISKKQLLFVITSTPLVTTLFYLVLRYFDTPYLFISTLSITTSYLASLFMIFRSRSYALFYAANDVVLIFLWGYTVLTDVSYLTILMCFIIFLSHDIYAFFNWKRLSMKQTI